MPVEQAVPVRNPQVVHSRLAGGESVLLHLDTGAYHELNAVGTAIWDLLDGQRTTAQIADQLRSMVEDPPAELETDIAGFIAQMRERDLVA